MSDRIKALLKKRESALAEAKKITGAAASDNDRDLSLEERGQIDQLLARVDLIDKDIKAQKAIEDAIKDEVPDPVDPAAARQIQITGGDPRILQDPKRGFRHAGEYFQAVVQGSRKGPNVVIDERLNIMATAIGSTYANESTGADGGFLVPPEFAATIREYSLEGDALLPFCQNDMVQGNSMKIPVSEQTPWGTTAIRAYWEGEAAAATATKPVLEMREWRLKKLLGLVPASDELIEDAAFMASWLPRQLGISIRWKTNDAIVRGNGTGQPTGYRNSGAQVSQAKETSQTADTIVAGNVGKMYARNLNPTRAIWLINPDSYNQLIVMTIGDQPIWTPPIQGIQNAPNGLLLGRPVIMCESCATLGDQNDIEFVDLTSYQVITKSAGIDFATSLHLYFEYDAMAFRARFRMDGASVFRAAVTPPVSAVTRSPFVTLDARA